MPPAFTPPSLPLSSARGAPALYQRGGVPRAPARRGGRRPRRAVAWLAPGCGGLEAARVRAAAGVGAVVVRGGVGAALAAAGAGGRVFAARRCAWAARALAAGGVRLVLVGEGVGVGVGVVGAAAVGVVGRPVVVEVGAGGVVEFRDGGGVLERRREVDERGFVERLVAALQRVYLPAGYPASVSQDYLSYTAYRVVQNLASAIMTVLSTECLLYSVGLGGKVKATAAASAWVLKDGLGYLTKVLFGSVCGRQFDLDPKSWRVTADFFEDVAGAIEVVMPLFQFPGSFVIVASLTNVLKGAAAMTGTATRHVIYRQLVAGGAENIGDVATKGESQGVTCKAIGLLSGVTISKRLGQNYPALLAAYAAFAVVHLAANWRSMECVQFSFFNKQRLSIALRDAFDGRPVPSPMRVSKHERIVLPPWRGHECMLVRVGARVSDAVRSPAHFAAARAQFKGERFVITRAPPGGLAVLLHRDARSEDAVRAYYAAQRFLREARAAGDPAKVAALPQAEYDAAMARSVGYMRRNIGGFLRDCRRAGWNTAHMLLTDSDLRADW